MPSLFSILYTALKETFWIHSFKLYVVRAESAIILVGIRKDLLLEQHRNMYTIKGETDHQPRLDAWDKRSDLVRWEDLEGAGGEGGGRGNRDGEDM